MRRVFVGTFGCKLNQYDSQVISESFASKGHELTSDMLAADVCIVNTCSVTARSDYEARQLVRKINRANPRALILVTGCYAQRAPHEVARIDGVGLVAGNAEKSSLSGLVESWQATGEGETEVGSAGGGPERTISGPGFQRRSRALVKIQDGCDGCCSYCVVPSVRGRSRSEPVELIRKQVESLEAAGFAEVVLTGASVGSYGNDLGNGQSLEGLLRVLLTTATELRVRLSSIEPGEITASLVESVAREERVCRHFHVPMQSGDAAILRAMRRPYSPDEYAEKIQAIHSSFPDACLGSDVIVGFPGESEAAFEKTCELIERLPLSYLHVFPFSRRPGTQAWQMGLEPTHSVKRARARVLRELGARKRSVFVESQMGVLAEAVLEEEVEPGLFRGTTGNYLRVLVRAQGKKPRDAIRVRVIGRADGNLLAQAC